MSNSSPEAGTIGWTDLTISNAGVIDITYTNIVEGVSSCIKLG